MGKVEAGLLEIEHLPFRLEQTIADAALFGIPISRKGLEYHEEISPYFPGTLLGDSNRLRQVLSNLLSNAIKFTKQGSITLRIEQLEEDNQEIAVAFSIVDTGMGIRESVIPYLFSPFHQADSSTSRLHGGSGLGLYISKSLVELMGGTIDLESAVGEGTSMTVRLRFVKLSETPVATPISAPMLTEGLDPASVAAPDPSRTRNPANYHILLAEGSRFSLFFGTKADILDTDNALIRDIITRTLTKMNFRVSTAVDGVETIKQVEKDHFDLMYVFLHLLDVADADSLVQLDGPANALPLWIRSRPRTAKIGSPSYTRDQDHRPDRIGASGGSRKVFGGGDEFVFIKSSHSPFFLLIRRLMVLLDSR